MIIDIAKIGRFLDFISRKGFVGSRKGLIISRKDAKNAKYYVAD
jgi:hypothetical protein